MMIEITIINSMIVNPAASRLRLHLFSNCLSFRLGESIFMVNPSSSYQFEYFVPSNAVPVDLE